MAGYEAPHDASYQGNQKLAYVLAQALKSFANT